MGVPERILFDSFTAGYEPLLGGWDYGYSRDDSGYVWVSLSVKNSIGNFPIDNVHVCTLPEGFRPIVTIPAVAYSLSSTRNVDILVAIQMDGKIMFYISSSEQQRSAYGFTVTFRAAE